MLQLQNKLQPPDKLEQPEYEPLIELNRKRRILRVAYVVN